MVELEVYRSGTGKTVSVGDYVKVDNKNALYKVLRIYETTNEGVLVDCYGGKKNHLLTRTFTVDRVARVVKQKEDVNEPLREALRETSAASKSKRKGWR